MGRLWSSVAAGAFVLAAVGFAQTSAGSAILRDTGVTGQPPAYTALSFATPKYLPTQLYSREALLPADFVIKNSAPAGRQFDWQVMEIRNGQDQQIASGRTVVGAGAAATVSRGFLASCVGGKIGISVRLAAPREAIEYWSTCVTSTAAP